MTVLPSSLTSAPCPVPGWYDELGATALYRPHLVLSGNLRDVYPDPAGRVLGLSLNDALWAVLSRRGVQGLLVYDPVGGVRLFRGADPQLEPDLRAAGLLPAGPVDLAQIQAGMSAYTAAPLALVVEYASHLLRHDMAARDRLFVSVDRSARQRPPARPDGVVGPERNVTLWLVDQPADLPDWFLIGNDNVREIRLDLPDLEERYAYARGLRGAFAQTPQVAGQGLESFALRTDGETLRSMNAIAALARAEGHGLAQLSDTLRLYRTGVRRNPWTSPVLRRRVAEGQARLSARVKGQALAIDKTLDVLSRAIMGLSGAQTGQRHGRPRGVLFFAGPTGVGKTELAKAVTELVFGDGQACHRFDMSEFMEAGSVTRLIGAPPGEPGHDRGGELINAIRRRPFSVFLFDEIEKAHPRILDTFLQILDEGRVTDARGSVAHFSETLIIFTSNIGTFGGAQAMNGGMNIMPSDSYAQLARKVNDAVQTHFRFTLKRPELMNRIGQNVVAFDFLDHGSISEIFAGLVARVLGIVESDQNCRITFAPEAWEALKVLCTHDVFDGGRGVGNRVETHLINPLARALFAAPPQREMRIVEVAEDDEARITRLRLQAVAPGVEPSPDRAQG